MDHLIEDHHKKHILYISGNKGHSESELRLESYKKSLAEHHIPFNPDYVFYGLFSDSSCGAKIITEALDNLHLSFDAVVCANDVMALSAITALEAHKIRVPYDVAVTGFDDIADAKFCIPPLTTVNASFSQVAKCGAERLFQIINGEKYQKNVEEIPSELVLRRSCGCLPDSWHLASSRDPKTG